MFLKRKILKKYFKDLLNIISNLDKEKYQLKEETCTKNGFQSINIISIFNKEILKNIINYKDFYKNVFHVHYIEYYKSGYQTIHNHEKTEKFSFIIYLNNSDGDTIFYNVNNKTIKVKPKERQLLIFDSSINHQALPSYKKKKILVGAIFKK
jgi:hypothetical protein